jgi:hypothetical protein
VRESAAPSLFRIPPCRAQRSYHASAASAAGESFCAAVGAELSVLKFISQDIDVSVGCCGVAQARVPSPCLMSIYDYITRILQPLLTDAPDALSSRVDSEAELSQHSNRIRVSHGKSSA